MSNRVEDDLSRSGNLNTVLEIVFLFLKNQNFFDTSEAFRKECEQLGITLPNKSGKVFFRTDEKISIIKNAEFIDQTIILETFLQKDTETDNSSGEKIPKYVSETEGKQHLKQQFSQLREEYKNLLTVTAELTKALQVHVVGQTKNINSVLDQCKVIYPSLFDQPGNDTEEEDAQDLNFGLNDSFSPKPHTETKSYIEVVTGKRNATENGVEEVVRLNFKQRNSISRSDGIDDILPTMLRNSATDNKRQRRSSEKNEEPLTNSGVCLEPNEEPKKIPCTPVSQRDILESDPNKVPYLPDVTEVIGPNCCPNKTCKDCTNQISKIVEEILSKVMVSPRCGASPHLSNPMSHRTDTNFNLDMEKAHCSHGEMKRENIELQMANDDVPEVYIFQRHSAHKENDFIRDKPLRNSENNVQCHSSVEHTPGKIMNATTLQPGSTTTQDKFPKKYHPKPVRLMKFQTPLCYVEACQKAQDVINNCKCAKCVPGKSRYYCGCYDLICKEIATEMESISSESTYKIFENFYKNEASEENPNNGENCSTYCENGSCKGAFVSKPRIRRTPPR